MHPEDILRSMRTMVAQDDRFIEAFVRGVTDGSISRPQAAAWLAYAFARGLTDDETVVLTGAMAASGVQLHWPAGPEVVDKHSTGGVGDKVSLVLAPLWAELGRRVPMISGRGLGHTGGTLDKLEAIPGYRTDLTGDELRRQLEEVGCFISGQTAEIAPADRVLYALRNETGTVESIPLIVASILSKKLAAGVRHLVLDVKAGSGAFMPDVPRATALAEALVAVARDSGLRCEAFVTEMGRPLGRSIGNALEVVEAIETLRGGGPADLVALTVALAGDPRAADVLASGAAAERFARMVAAQGGDPRILEDPSRLRGGGVDARVIEAPIEGVVARMDAGGLGRAAFLLGAGRRRAEDPVDFGVGLTLHVGLGDLVSRGQPLVTVHHRQGRSLEEALAAVADALVVSDEVPTVPPLIHRRIG